MAKQVSNPEYSVRNTTNKQIGKKLKERRKLLKMTQQKLANEVGCTFQQIQKYEAGLNNISPSILLKLCEVLNCSPYYFFSNFHFSDNNNIDNSNIKTNLTLDDIELQLILKFRQLPNIHIKQSIINLLQNIITME